MKNGTHRNSPPDFLLSEAGVRSPGTQQGRPRGLLRLPALLVMLAVAALSVQVMSKATAYGQEAAGDPTPEEIAEQLIEDAKQMPPAAEWLASHPDHPRQTTPFLEPDFDGDTIGDLIFPAWGLDEDAPITGVVTVVSGYLGEELFAVSGEEPNDLFGFQALGVPDTNGDGRQDLVVSAPGNGEGAEEAGKVYVYSGVDGSLLWTVTGQALLGGLGSSVASAGDVNNDGLNDIIVGEPMGESPGRAYVFFGRPAGEPAQSLTTGDADMAFTGEALLDGFGLSVSGAGDVDGDGFDDLIVGAPGNDAAFAGPDADAGAAYIYSGATGEPLMIVRGHAPTWRAGWSVSGAGDMNNDGYADIILGAPGDVTEDAEGNLVGASRAYVFFGGGSILDPTSTEPDIGALPVERTTLDADLTLAPHEPGDILFGVGVELGNDIMNKDGSPEVLVTAFSQADGVGRAYVYSGQGGALLTTFLLNDSTTIDMFQGQAADPMTSLMLVIDNFGETEASGPEEGDLNTDTTVDSTDLEMALQELEPPDGEECLDPVTGLMEEDWEGDGGTGGDDTGGGGPGPDNGDPCENMEALLMQTEPLTQDQCEELLACGVALNQAALNNLPNTPEGMAFNNAKLNSQAALATSIAQKKGVAKINIKNVLLISGGVALVSGGGGALFGGGIGAVVGAVGGAIVGAGAGIIIELQNQDASVSACKKAVWGDLPAGTVADLGEGIWQLGQEFQQASQALLPLLQEAAENLSAMFHRISMDCPELGPPPF